MHLSSIKWRRTCFFCLISILHHVHRDDYHNALILSRRRSVLATSASTGYKANDSLPDAQSHNKDWPLSNEMKKAFSISRSYSIEVDTKNPEKLLNPLGRNFLLLYYIARSRFLPVPYIYFLVNFTFIWFFLLFYFYFLSVLDTSRATRFTCFNPSWWLLWSW